MGDNQGDDDAQLVRRIAVDRDERALAVLLERHAPKVTGALRSRFRHQLQHPDIDEAVNRAALKLWNNASRFDRNQPLGPWLLTIAHRAALDILKGERRRPTKELEFDPPDPFAANDDEQENSSKTDWISGQLEQIIDFELKGFEQVVAQTDAAAGGPGCADTQLLMKKYNKNKNVVQATRSKVWKKVREMIQEREAIRDHKQVNP